MREAIITDFISAVFCCQPANSYGSVNVERSVMQSYSKLDLRMMSVSGTHYVPWTSGSRRNSGTHTGYIPILLFGSAVGPHSWVINRQIREVGRVAWMALTNLSALPHWGNGCRLPCKPPRPAAKRGQSNY